MRRRVLLLISDATDNNPGEQVAVIFGTRIMLEVFGKSLQVHEET